MCIKSITVKRSNRDLYRESDVELGPLVRECLDEAIENDELIPSRQRAPGNDTVGTSINIRSYQDDHLRITRGNLSWFVDDVIETHLGDTQ